MNAVHTLPRIEAKRRLPVHPPMKALGRPSGWFVAATSEQLPAGGKVTTTFMSEEPALYRTASGEARAISAHCPHLGAHECHVVTALPPDQRPPRR